MAKIIGTPGNNRSDGPTFTESGWISSEDLRRADTEPVPSWWSDDGEPPEGAEPGKEFPSIR